MLNINNRFETRCAIGFPRFIHNRCSLCGHLMIEGNNSTKLQCTICNEWICTDCAKYGICWTHYELFDRRFKLKILTYNYFPKISLIFLPIMIVLLGYSSIFPQNIMELYQENMFFFAFGSILLTLEIFILSQKQIKKCLLEIQIEKNI